MFTYKKTKCKFCSNKKSFNICVSCKNTFDMIEKDILKECNRKKLNLDIFKQLNLFLFVWSEFNRNGDVVLYVHINKKMKNIGTIRRNNCQCNINNDNGNDNKEINDYQEKIYGYNFSLYDSYIREKDVQFFVNDLENTLKLYDTSCNNNNNKHIFYYYYTKHI